MFAGLDQILSNLYFALFAAIALGSGVGLSMTRHPLNGALCLIATMLSLAGIYALLAAPFLAVLQVLVYAGAVMMLVVFVIMVLNRAKDSALPRIDLYGAFLAAPALALAALVAARVYAATPATNPGAVRGEPAPIAARLFDLTPAGPGYYLLFLAVGIALLVAVVAAILLAKRRLEPPVDAPVPGEAHDHA
jgi:NADH-quinone oxidoreductase subunit J